MPPCMPMITSRPSGASAARFRSRYDAPMMSRITSAPVPPVAARTRSTKSSPRWEMTMSAPRSVHSSNLAVEPAVAATVAPNARATWIAWVPMPLAPPWMRMTSLPRRCAVITRLDHTVQAASGRAAASGSVTPAGIGITCPAGTATYWA